MASFSMTALARSRTEGKQLLRLALPICGAQLAQAGMSTVDVIMAGRASATDLAAVSVGASLWVPLMLFMTGTLIGLTPIVAQHFGADKKALIRPSVHQALWVALVLGCAAAGLIWALVEPVFRFMDVPPHVASLSTGYLHAVAFGIPGVAFYQTLRAYSDGMNHTRPALWISLIGLGVNVPCNYVLIYGGAGMTALLGDYTPALLTSLPALGAVGCGIATALAMWVMCGAMIMYTHRARAYRGVSLWSKPAAPNRKLIFELLHIGLPIGVAIFAEVTLFTLIALFIAGYGEVVVAAHQVALNFTSLLFMLPLSLGMALTVRVSNTLGQGNAAHARFVAWNGVGLSLGAAMINNMILLATASWVVTLYSSNAEVQHLAKMLMYLAVIHQISDALQVNMAGALRGYKDTRIIMAITLFSYWVVGLGGGHLLGKGWQGVFEGLGVYGYWIGLIAGLTVAASLLGLRLNHISKALNNGKRPLDTVTE
ncbi:MATE family efflux transporter [Phytohalomonas tamaricis]|uniref:MATE family efflux transporter n=1 Tax=Phytohalomonas tamaricis TaxID=2081032 RepID=UPI0021D46EA0|nr:MATE family efflux transporter [Phytohalomonas tamaricis]